jgi:hypothetical protein
VDKCSALECVETIRGEPTEESKPSWNKGKSSRFGEDLVGGWLLKNGGLLEGLQKAKRLRIPEGGFSAIRIADWLLARRIIVEVKTYGHNLSKGGSLSNTRQFSDYARWRNELPNERAVVLARVTWNNNSSVGSLFTEDLRHFDIPVIFFQW